MSGSQISLELITQVSGKLNSNQWQENLNHLRSKGQEDKVRRNCTAADMTIFVIGNKFVSAQYLIGHISGLLELRSYDLASLAQWLERQPVD